MSFSIRCLFLLMKRDLHTQWRNAFLALAAAIAVIIVLGVLVAWQGDTRQFHDILFPLLFLPGGYILTSRSFSDLHHKASIRHFILLPAGAGEKTLSRLLFSGPCYLLLAIFGYSIAALCAHFLTLLLFRNAIPFFTPFTRNLRFLYDNYLASQSLFFLGAAWFRKNHFLKTVLTLTLLSFFFSLLGLLAQRLAFGGLYQLNHLDPSIFRPLLGRGLMEGLIRCAKIFYWGILPPFCWLVSWLRIREAEVSHGV